MTLTSHCNYRSTLSESERDEKLTPSDFDAIADALESNTAYGNIHTTKFPAGEIRGQIHRGDRDDDDDNR